MEINRTVVVAASQMLQLTHACYVVIKDASFVSIYELPVNLPIAYYSLDAKVAERSTVNIFIVI